jgi:heme-degrading monooxygenase HmoA
MRRTDNVSRIVKAWRMHGSVLLLSWACVSAACDDEGARAPTKQACASGTLEADLDGTPWQGSAVDESGELMLSSGRSYMLSSTYGIPVPGPDGAPITEKYGQLLAAIQEQLMKQPGLLAFRLGSSDACRSGRTLAVWESEEAMYEFVASPAHAAAMAAVHEVLRPGYGVTHGQTTQLDQISFAQGARQLAREANAD